MQRRSILLGAAVLGALCGSAAQADFELTAPDGRRILLKDDQTWRYLEPEAGKAATPEAKVAKPPTAADAKPSTADAKPSAADAKPSTAAKDAKPDADKTKDEGEALLSLEGKVSGNRICRYQLKLVNNLPYEIRSLVPEFSVFRPNGVVYDAQFSAFGFIKPGDSQRREVRFNGIDCEDIARVQVGGGDRCEMGELDKFSRAKGKCLALVRVLASEVVKFDK